MFSLKNLARKGLIKIATKLSISEPPMNLWEKGVEIHVA